MSADEPDALPTPESIAAFVRKNAPKMKKAGMLMMHHGDPEVVREDDYKGHHITIRTVYHIEVDGKPLMGHLAVTNDGQVQSHGLPNYSFDSAVFLVRQLIDSFPEDFAAGTGKPDAPEMPDIPDMPKMGGMPGMRAQAKSRTVSKAASGKKSAPAKKRPAARKSK